MAAAVVQLFTYVNGRHLQSSATLEPIFKTVSVSSDGSDNGTKITEVSGKFDFNNKKLSNVAAGTASGEVLTYDQRGAANGVASLDGSGKIPAAQLTIDATEYKGGWNANTNSPSLANGTGNTGDIYAVTFAKSDDNLGTWYTNAPAAVSNGSNVVTITEVGHGRSSGQKITTTTALAIGGISAGNLSRTATAITVVDADTFTYIAGANATGDASGTIDTIAVLQSFSVGDWVIYDGTVWQLVTNSVAVSSVNGFTGVVVLTTSDIAEGTNLYYTAARFNSAFAGKSTTDLAEGTNLYYTAARFNSAFAAKSTSDLSEGTNLYFTDARAKAAAVADSITDGVTDVAPSQNAVFDALALKVDKSSLYRTFQNDQGGSVAHTVRQLVFQSSAGKTKLLGAGTASVNEDSFIAMVRDTSIADQASGTYYLPGQIVSGFSGLTINSPIYASKATPGSFQQDQTGFVTGDKVIKLGKVLSATEVYFNPSFEYVIGG